MIQKMKVDNILDIGIPELTERDAEIQLRLFITNFKLLFR